MAAEGHLAGAAPAPAQAQRDWGERTVSDGIEAYNPRWRPDGTTVCYAKEDSLGVIQVFHRQLVPLMPEQQLTCGEGDCETPVYDPSGSWVAFGCEDAATGIVQVWKVLLTSPGLPEQVTFTPWDKSTPEWSPDGQYIVYSADDPSSYCHVWRAPAAGGSEVQLTFGPFDDEHPSYLAHDKLVFQRTPNLDYAQIWRLDLVTMQLTRLTDGPTDHETPCPASDGSSIAYAAIDSTGGYNIGLVSAAGGDERFITSEPVYDVNTPDWSSDGASIFAVREAGLNSEIVRIDVPGGTTEPVADASALRDNPDTYFDPTSCHNFVVYEREDLNATDGIRPKPKRRPGTGIFLVRHRRVHDGITGSGLDVLALDRVGPNPSAGKVAIRWFCPARQHVTMKLYDCSGSLVRTLVDWEAKPGPGTAIWDSRDNRGRSVSNGVYLLKLAGAKEHVTYKLVVQR